MTSFQRSIWLSGALLLGCADAPVDATGAGASGSGTTSTGPQGRVCNLPVSPTLQVIDLESSGSSDLFFVLLSDQTALVFGNALPPLEYEPLAEGADAPCLTRIIDGGGETVGPSYGRSVTMIDYNPDKFGLDAAPKTLDLLSADIATVALGGDVVAVDVEGQAWILRGRIPGLDIEVSGRFEPLDLPHRAVSADGASGWCVVLETGRVWCTNRSNGPPRFGGDIGFGVLTELGIDDAKAIVLSVFNSCWLDSVGTTRCAGRSDGLILGYPDGMFPEFLREEYDVVPGLPPLERLWIKVGGACGLTESGDLWCWGDNFWGQIDPDSEETLLYPTLAGSFPGLRDVALSTDSICVLRADNIVVCRGLSQKSVPGACWGVDGWYRMPFAGPINCGEGI